MITKGLPTIFRLLALLAVLSMAGPSLAQEEEANPSGEAKLTIDQRINAAIAPLTNAVSSVMFSGIEFSTDKETHGAIALEGLTLNDPDLNADSTDARERIILPFVVIWLAGGAIFFTIFMKFINFRGFRQAIRITKGTYDNPDDPGEVTHFQALSAALSGTVGLGNIAGVALAVSIGGAGATFWMILAGLLGMTSKFVECTLGVHYREIDENGVVSGGPMYYLSRGLAEKGLPGLGKILAALSAILILGGTIGSGALFQVNQATQQFAETFQLATGWSLFVDAGWSFGLIFATLAGFVIIGGIRKIVRVTEFLVPIMGILYLGAAIVIIGFNLGELPGAFNAIIDGAFSAEGVTGGFIGVLVQGMRRATFSNEAGIGSAAIAHAAAKTKEPIAEGLVALLEPFVDTVIVCTATALVIIITGLHEAEGLNGITRTSAAFATVFDWFPYLLTVAVVLFAFSTAITWFYYGQRSLAYLTGPSRSIDFAYKATFLGAMVVGSAMPLTAVMDFADSMILGMAFPNMLGLFILAPKVKQLLNSYQRRLASGEIQPYRPPPAVTPAQ